MKHISPYDLMEAFFVLMLLGCVVKLQVVRWRAERKRKYRLNQRIRAMGILKRYL